MDTTALVLGVLGVLVGAGIGYAVRHTRSLKQVGSVERKIHARLGEAEEQAKKIILEAETKSATILADIKREERERQAKLSNLETRVLQREEFLDKKLMSITDQETALRTKTDEVAARESEIGKLRDEAQARIEKAARLTMEEAREELFRQMQERSRQDLAHTLQKISKEEHEEIEKKSLEIITVALQRYARAYVSELTTSVFPLRDEDLKGKIIGREGRNIRTLERATGVEFIIDEVPDAIVISSFDPLRREIARLALDKLVKDGRIQPAKIEEKVEEARQEIEKRMMEVGEAAAMEVGVYDLPKELIRLLGRLHFRTSYGQNVLTHSIEMAHMAGMIAAELGLNVEVAKKGALVHDIGKAIDHEVEGTHVDLGMKLLRKYNVAESVIQAMQSHHDDYPYASPEAYVVTAVDALSAARPGARRDSIEQYIKRLGDLEKIATDFPGVKNAYAISAGRELRVFVVPEKVDDFGALELARSVANRIQSELKYPGEIKVNVIREVRAVEYAR